MESDTLNPGAQTEGSIAHKDTTDADQKTAVDTSQGEAGKPEQEAKTSDVSEPEIKTSDVTEPGAKTSDVSETEAKTSDVSEPEGKPSDVPEKNVDHEQEAAAVHVSEQPNGQNAHIDNRGIGVEDASKEPPHHPSVSKFVLILTFFTTIGGFLLGYDIGIMSGSMLYFRPYFKLSTLWAEAIVSAAVGSAAVSAISGGWVMDTIGRRPTLLISSVVFSIGGIFMGVSITKEMLLIGRLICGIGIGLASVVIPVYMAEASPVRLRGRLTLMWQIMINLGVFLSSVIAGGFSYLPLNLGWRFMLGLSAVPGIVQFIGFLFMPESPRWLVDKGHIEQAQQTLVRTRGVSDVTEELDDIRRTVNEAKAQKLKGCSIVAKVFTTPPVRRALITGLGLLIFQQFCGINTAIYYSGTVMKMAGFPVKHAVWLVVVPNALLFFAGLTGIYVVDRIGRKPLLIWSMVGTIVGLIIIAVGFQLSETYSSVIDPNLMETFENGTSISRCFAEHSTCASCAKDDGCGFCGGDFGTCLPAANEERSLYGRCNASDSDSTFRFAHGFCPSDNYSWIIAAGVALFVCLFAPGMAPMPWTINAEIYPLWARGTCNSMAATSCWVSNLFVSFTFLSLTEAITPYGTFWMFTGISLIGLLFFILLVPETKDKCLENVEELFMTQSELADLMAKRQKADAAKTEEENTRL